MTQQEYRWNIEVIDKDAPRGRFKHAIFDFDGTISLIREGWQKIMIPYFTEELLHTPQGKTTDRTVLEELAQDFIFLNTGKQTIYQCIRLAEEVERLGGTPLTPQEYKDEYHRRLSVRIEGRIQGLNDRTQNPLEHMVPGSYKLLDGLKARGIKLYLASGTDEVYVKQEAGLLGMEQYFGQQIYGAQDDYKSFSKKMVIDRIIQENSLHGSELLGFGDGYVEIENVKSVGGFACGVATDETNRWGVDQWKRERLTRSHADIIIPDFTEAETLLRYLFKED